MRVVALMVAGMLMTGCSTAARFEPVSAEHVAVVVPPKTQTVIPTTQTAATRDVSSPIPIVQLRGGPPSLAAGANRQIGSQIKLLQQAYLNRYFRNESQKQFATGSAMLFATHIRTEHWREIVALSKETGIELGDIVLAQCFLDLSPMQACSTIALPASASPDGVARMGRNLDFPSFNVADKNSVLLVYHPDGAYSFVSIGWPGMIGVLTGMNEHGLTLANMEVTRGSSRPRAMPYPLLYRTVLEQCQTVEEAIELLRNTPRQTPNNLMLTDAAGDRAVVELTPERIEVRRAAADEPLISTNHQRGTDTFTPGRCVRYDTLLRMAASDRGQIDTSAIETMMKAVAQGDMTLQSMVFEPSNRLVHLATGSNAATRQHFRLDLKRLFQEQ